MAWIHRYISDEDIQKISEAVKRAEEQTDGEIVPVIVRRSSAIGHVPMTLSLLILLILVIFELPFSDLLWVRPWVYAWPLLVFVVYYFSHLLTRLSWIQKIFVPERDELDQVHQRAHLEFYLNRVNKTHHHTGILIFISVMERKAVILADKGISSKLPQDTWYDVLAKLAEQLRQGNWSFGFIEAIEHCGHHLKTHFPASTPKQNELPNQLIIK